MNHLARKIIISLVFAALFIGANANAVVAELEKWAHDRGPDISTELGENLNDLNAAIPNMPKVAKELMGREAFRPFWGAIPWRMQQKPNSVKILFIGQDGTHIAEAAGRPATAGFGGRAQDLANYFGVDYSAAFINTYAFTIKGQYSYRNTPYVYQQKEDNEANLRFGNLTTNGTWLVTQDQRSPVVKWRNSLIDWIIRNNRDSLKLIILFGGSARDSAGSFFISKGAKVGTKFSPKRVKNISIPFNRLQFAGGNNKVASPVDIDGKDLYSDVVGEKINYKDSKLVNKAMDDLSDKVEQYLNEMVYTHGGKDQSGLLDPAQLGGYDLSKVTVKGEKTISLKGLPLSDGSSIENNILVVQLPHPTYLSGVVRESDNRAKGKEKVRKLVMGKVNLLKPYRDNEDWNIEADEGQVNQFNQHKDYEYRRADIGPSFYDFGTPKNRMVSVSSAKRLDPATIMFGDRKVPKFDSKEVAAMKNIKPAEKFSNEELFTNRPRSEKLRKIFDPGPAEGYAKLMIENLDSELIFTAKKGKSYAKDGIDAYNVKSHPDVDDFGHYRGKFLGARALILADPIGYDDLLTARALTGARGQYLQTLMKDLGIAEDYLLLKTVPFAMDGASEEEWNIVLKQTKDYRQKVIDQFLEDNKGKIDFIIADGKNAQSEIKRIVKQKIPVIEMNRLAGVAESGIQKAGKDIVRHKDLVKKYGKVKLSKKARSNIPRSHLSYYARVWEGTSGDRVITSTDKKKMGKIFFMVVPKWATSQKAGLSSSSKDAVVELKLELENQGLPAPGEKARSFVERKFNGEPLDWAAKN